MQSKIILSALFVSMGIKLINDTCSVTVNKVQIESEKWTNKQPLRIIQISDMHNRKFGKNNEKVFRQLKKFTPDIVLITGDLIDRSTKEFSRVKGFIQELTLNCPHVYFVNGNHECEHPREQQLHQILIENGVKILNNENIVCNVEGNSVNIIGINDAATDHDDLQKATDRVDGNYYTILLSHAPNIVWKEEEAISKMNLILSGHTHGGQLRIPFIGALVIPEQKFPATYDQGTYKLDKDCTLYIDHGLGTTRLPVRLFCRSQITYMEVFHKEN